MKGFIAGAGLLLLCTLAQLPFNSSSAQGLKPVPAVPAPRDQTQRSPSQGDQTLKPSYSGGDASFFKSAASAGLAEISAGQMAEKKASDSRVRQFGQQMVKDHTQVAGELQALAKSKGVTLPQAPDEEQRQQLDKLKAKQGADFDKAYVKAQVEAHKDAVALFKSASASTDPQVSAFAQKALPTLQHHLQMIEALDQAS